MSRSGIATAASLLLGVTLGLGPVQAPATAQAAPKPAVTQVGARSGATTGGYDVTIKGSGFKSVKKVLFNQAKARDVRVRNGSKLVVEAPAHAAGPVTVKVVTQAGSSAQSAKAQFTYTAPAPALAAPAAAAPGLGSVSPAAGPTTGGTVVTLTGADLADASEVRFGSTVATILSAAPGSLSVRTAARAAGPATVTVTTPSGTAALPDAFTFVAAPNLTGVSPGTGPTAGSTVTLTGTGFTPTTSVLFGGNPGRDVQVAAGGQQLTVRAPARTAGFVDVTVTTVGGSATLTRGFQYVAGVGITGITPAAGPTAGGSKVTITGIGFTGNSLVTFDNKPSPEVLVNLAGTELTAELPPHAAGAVDVLVATVGGVAFRADGFTYVDAPTLTSVAPDAGPVSGGTRVTLAGTGLRAGMSVGFGGTSGTLRSVSADGTSATVDTPAHPAGPVEVSVTTPGGTATRAAAYTFVGSPDLTGVAPDTGPRAGGQRVTLSGTGFAAGMTVRFGTLAAADVDVTSPTQATVTTPARAPGTVAVSIGTPGGSVSVSDAYTYVAAPTLTGLAPAVGPTGGGTTVTLTGTGLRPGVQVRFGGQPAALVSVDAAGISATVLTPAHVPGTVDVTATTAGGTATLADDYTYTAAPTLASVTPGSGPTDGETAVTLTGTGLTAGMQVRLGGTLATVGSVNAAGTSASVTTPPHAPGVVDVSVVSPGGPASLPGGFEYVVAPSLDSLTPEAGPTSGGQQVTLRGSGLRSDMQVRFGRTVATLVSVNPAGTTATVTTPARSAAVVDVSVTSAGGTATLAGAYTSVVAPSLGSVSPASGPTGGGQEVTLRGTGFRAGLQVTFDGVPATGVVVESGAKLTATVPPHAPGAVTVAVTSPGGSASLAGAYEYVAGPSLALVTPAAGPTAGGQTVTLTGTGLRPDMTVRFGPATATVATVDPAGTSATVTTPVRPAGAVDVTVTTAGGAATLTNGFEYVAAPTLAAVDPVAGPTAGGQVVTLTGTRLRPDMQVRFGPALGTVLAVDPDGRTASVATPGRPAGVVAVAVATPGGVATLADAYTYVVTPVLTSVAPPVGSTTGGTRVTVRGSGFRDGMAVVFGDTPVTGLVVESPTRASLVTPPGVVGAADVSVRTPGGTSTLAAAYEYVAVPTLTTVTPAAGPTAGGQTAMLAGSGFRAGMQVRFGPALATVASIDPAGSAATVLVPSRSAGRVDVTVMTPGGVATLTGGYEHVGAPTLISLTPATGPSTGGQVVMVKGNRLRPDMEVRFGPAVATLLTVDPDGRTATVATPPGPAGPVAVSVTTPGGAASLEDGYLYVASPVLDSVAPAVGGTAGGQRVTVRGSGFRAGMTVTFDGVRATGLVVESAVRASVVTPAHAAGAVDVSVSSPGGSAVLPASFEYVATPVLTDVSPAAGPATGGEVVTLTGTGLRTGMTVRFGPTSASVVSVDPAGTSATVTTPARKAGTVAVSVATPGGVATRAPGYTFVVTPTLTSVAPASGPAAGGQTVTLRGTGFRAGLAVTFGGVPATGLTVVSGAQVTVLSPPHDAGAVDVEVSSPGGSASLAAAYEYLP